MNRRNFLGLLAAPAIIRVADLMPIRAVVKSPALVPVVYGRMQFVTNDLSADGVMSLEQYAKRCLAEIARNLDVRYELLTGDHIAKALTRHGLAIRSRPLGGISNEELVRRIAQT